VRGKGGRLGSWEDERLREKAENQKTILAPRRQEKKEVEKLGR
jgi:hypothetical protein